MQVTQYQEDFPGGRTGKKNKGEIQEMAKKTKSFLPVLPCPFSPSQKHRSIQTAPASSEFLLILQRLCCLKLSWSPVKRAIRDCAFCSLIFFLCILDLLLLPPPQHSSPRGCCGNALAPCSASELVPLCSARPPREQPSGSSGDQTGLVTLETKHRWIEHQHLLREKPRAISLLGWKDRCPPCSHATGTPW